MRMGPHVMLPIPPAGAVREMYERWITVVRPPVVKFCRQGLDPALLAWTRAQGSRIVARYVDVELGNSGAANARAADRVLAELLPFADRLDYVEFANEELQGRDDPREWDRLMAACLVFMRRLDEANRAAGRDRPRACIANTSVGQPEIERWSRASTMEAARYAAAHGHVWGLHEYYKPDPWAMVEGGRAAWDGPPPAEGWLMLRCTKAVRIFRAAGIPFRFIITESGRDNVPGQPGPGGGFRDVPGEPYAERMAQYGRHLSALPECVGWVDFGYNAWDGWRQFDLTRDPAEHERMVIAMAALPRGAPEPPSPARPPSQEPPMTAHPPTVNRPAVAHSSRGGARVRYIVVHSTDSPVGATPATTAAYLQQNDRGVSVHELVNPGETYVMVSDDRAAHHAGNSTLPDGTTGAAVNAASWGIEIYQVRGQPCDPALVERAAVRVADACRRLSIPWTRVVMHREVDPGRRADPVGVDGDAFRRRVAELLGVDSGHGGSEPGGRQVDYAKIVWAIEEAVRILEREGRGIDAGYIKSAVLPPLISRRDRR